MQDKDCEDLHLLVQKNLVLSNINAIFAAEFYWLRFYEKGSKNQRATDYDELGA